MSGNFFRVTDTDFPRYLRSAMESARIRRASELASKSGIAESLISRWLRGANVPDLASLRPLQEPLGLGLRELAVAAGHMTAEEAGLDELPTRPEPLVLDTAEQEIRDAGLPSEIEEALIDQRRRELDNLRATLQAMRPKSGKRTSRVRRTGTSG